MGEAAQRVTMHVPRRTTSSQPHSRHTAVPANATKRYSYEFTEKHKAETMPKKRFLGNRSFKIMGGAPQCFNAPDGARGARPMSLRSGNQSQWLGSSRVGSLMRQDVYIENDGLGDWGPTCACSTIREIE